MKLNRSFAEKHKGALFAGAVVIAGVEVDCAMSSSSVILLKHLDDVNINIKMMGLLPLFF